MTINEAKKILELYRPGANDGADLEVAQALALARQDPELAGWLDERVRLQKALQRKFREIPVPVSLKGDILAHPKQLVRPPWWRDPDWLPLAACIVLLLSLCVALEGMWKGARVPDHFVDFEGRMVRSALREYRMDILTNDLPQVRHHLSTRGAPADFPLPIPLTKLSVMGGGVLHWRNNPVSMVCFDRGDKQMLFLFVMNRTAVKDPPGCAPSIQQISSQTVLGWSEGDKAYVLAGPEEADFLKKYF